nr:MAG TPA: hypothetical protein [Caudoviricetes sp.]
MPPVIRMSGNMSRKSPLRKVFRGLTCQTHPDQQNKSFQYNNRRRRKGSHPACQHVGHDPASPLRR